MDKSIFNVESISCAIQNSVGELEIIFGYRIMFGAVVGSCCLDLHNSSSDIDYYIVVDGELSPQHAVRGVDIRLGVGISIERQTVDVNFLFISYQRLLREIRVYRNLDRQYPTVLHRTEQEMRNNLSNKDEFRPDFIRSVLFRILMSGSIMNKKTAESRLKEFTDGIQIIDIIDYQFTRIYGNYMENIRNKEFVSVRKYLYTIHEILLCLSFMKIPKSPPIDILGLIEYAEIDDDLKGIVLDLYKQNKLTHADKDMALVPKNEKLNKFVEDGLLQIYHFIIDNITLDEALQF